MNLFGFSPMEAIVAATRQGAELMRMQNQSGFQADILVLDGNPLDEIRLLQDQAKILAVMKGGRFAKQDASLSQHGRSRKAA